MQYEKIIIDGRGLLGCFCGISCERAVLSTLPTRDTGKPIVPCDCARGLEWGNRTEFFVCNRDHDLPRIHQCIAVLV